MQLSASITYCPSPSEIALTGHCAAQLPHIMHASEILYAMNSFPPSLVMHWYRITFFHTLQVKILCPRKKALRERKKLFLCIQGRLLKNPPEKFVQARAERLSGPDSEALKVLAVHLKLRNRRALPAFHNAKEAFLHLIEKRLFPVPRLAFREGLRRFLRSFSSYVVFTLQM